MLLDNPVWLNHLFLNTLDDLLCHSLLALPSVLTFQPLQPLIIHLHIAQSFKINSIEQVNARYIDR